jgi:hypothetical protein
MVSSGDDAAMLPKGGSIAEVSSCRSVVILSEAKDLLFGTRRKAGPSLRSG